MLCHTSHSFIFVKFTLCHRPNSAVASNDCAKDCPHKEHCTQAFGRNTLSKPHNAHYKMGGRMQLSSADSDPKLIDIFKTRHPNHKVPCPNMIWHDVKAAYIKCHEWISKLLQEHLGCIHFATNCWTSTNHHTFIAWAVHLEHQGAMLAFLQDIIEVPESHIGTASEKAFQKMLRMFGLQDCILAISADNGSANDTQTKALSMMKMRMRMRMKMKMDWM